VAVRLDLEAVQAAFLAPPGRRRERCDDSRTDEAEIVGSQSPSSQTVRRPMWVSWTIVAVPCA
jgi:hypothetical protein